MTGEITNRMSNDKVQVLDKGYVELINVMGDDLSVANAARASFQKRHATLDESDKKLIRFLVREGHTSPFRHQFLTFEIKAPLMVARQWWKYVVGSDHTMDGWNEVSRRYVSMEPEFYIPDQWRSAPENKKQGSGAAVNESTSATADERIKNMVSLGVEHYNWALASGICAEQARGYLPAYFMYTNWWWSASLQSVLHFLGQRLADDAQKEIQEYALAIFDLIKPHFPNSLSLVKGD